MLFLALICCTYLTKESKNFRSNLRRKTAFSNLVVDQMRLEIKIRKVMFLDIFPTPVLSGHKDVCGRMLVCFVFFLWFYKLDSAQFSVQGQTLLLASRYLLCD